MWRCEKFRYCEQEDEKAGLGATDSLKRDTFQKRLQRARQCWPDVHRPDRGRRWLQVWGKCVDSDETRDVASGQAFRCSVGRWRRPVRIRPDAPARQVTASATDREKWQRVCLVDERRKKNGRDETKSGRTAGGRWAADSRVTSRWESRGPATLLCYSMADRDNVESWIPPGIVLQAFQHANKWRKRGEKRHDHVCPRQVSASAPVKRPLSTRYEKHMTNNYCFILTVFSNKTRRRTTSLQFDRKVRPCTVTIETDPESPSD